MHGRGAHEVEHQRFEQLRLDQRRGHLEKRLLREDHFAFGDRSELAGEVQASEPVEEVAGQTGHRTQERDGLVVEHPLAQRLHHFARAGGHEEVALRRLRAHEELE